MNHKEKRSLLFFGVLVFFLSFLGQARADGGFGGGQQGGGRRQGGGRGGACKQYIDEWCSDKRGDHSEMIKCLEAHKDELSDGCKEMLEKMKSRSK